MDSDGLQSLLGELPVVSSHCHHLPTDQQQSLDLDKLLSHSYVGWCGLERGSTAAERQRFLDQVGFNTYFVWLSKAVEALYGLGPVSADNWEALSAALRQAHSDPEYHFRLLRERCRYKFAVEDAYWNAGDDLGRPDLFHPAYRINAWVMSYRPGATDHGGNSPWTRPGFDPHSLDEYLDLMEAAIEQAVAHGAVAVKSALAYDRPLSFDNPDVEAARRAFRSDAEQVSAADRLAFGDVVMHRICRACQRLQLPLQVHLGLGIISGSRPMFFEPVIAKYPEVTFDLFHCGYPWCDELAGILHNYPNVVADFCWLPLISTTAAVYALHQYLEVVRSCERIVWGDDTWTSEEAYGALLAWEYVVGRVLGERLQQGLCSASQAERMAEKLMYANAQKLFQRP